MVNENPKSKSNSDRTRLIPMERYANPVTPQTPLNEQEIAYEDNAHAGAESTKSGIIADGIRSAEDVADILGEKAADKAMPEKAAAAQTVYDVDQAEVKSRDPFISNAPLGQALPEKDMVKPVKPNLESQADSLIKTVFSAVFAVNGIGGFHTGYVYSKTGEQGSRLDGELGVDYGNIKPRAVARGCLDEFTAKYNTQLPSLEIIVSKMGSDAKIDSSKLKEAEKKVEQAEEDYDKFSDAYSGISSAISRGDSNFDYKNALNSIFSVVNSSENGNFSFKVPIKDLFSYAGKLSDYMGFLAEELKITGAYALRDVLDSEISALGELRDAAKQNPEMSYAVDFSAADAVLKHEAKMNLEAIKEKEASKSAPEKKSFAQRFVEYFSKPSNPAEQKYRTKW